MPAMPGAARPPQGAPQGAPQPGGAPQGAAPQGQQQSPAAQAVQMIEHGFQGLGQLIQQAGKSLPPEDIQLFQTAMKATEAMIQSLSGAASAPQGQPQQAGPKPPMPANAAPGSKPASY